jgi:hypothetical protein
MTQGDDFPDVHRTLVGCGVMPIEAFTITTRVFRAGGLTKDAVYLRGLGDIVAHVASGGRLDVLWLGKMALTDVPYIEELRSRGVLSDPLLLPRFLAEPGVAERLAWINASTTLVDLLGGPA